MDSNADLQHLVLTISTGEGSAFKVNGARSSLQEIFSRNWDGLSELAVYKLINQHELLAYVDGSRKITLTKARRAAFLLGINLVDLLCGNANGTRPLCADWLLELPKNLAPVPHRRWSRTRISSTKSGLTVALCDPAGPSLRSTAESLQVSVGGLWHHHPELCEQVIQHHKEKVVARERLLTEKADGIIRKEIADWSFLYPDKPTRTGVFKKLYSKSGIGKRLLKRRIAVLLPKSGSGSPTP